ncbi:MAG: ATP-binding protein, partial [Chloroflexi bacterium]
MSSGFVGRRVELALLDSVCSKANADNRPAAALISGVPGSGKSRLLAELRSRRRATHVLGVVGYESAFQVPLGAAANLLRGLGKVSDAGETLREFLFSPNPADDRSLEPLRLFEAARRALLGLEGSVLLVADDLQWVDDLSLALCSYLVRSAAEEEIPFAVIAATRPTSRGLAFHDSLLKDLGEDRVWTIDLGPLEPDEGVQLIRQLGPQLSAQRVAELWTQS